MRFRDSARRAGLLLLLVGVVLMASGLGAFADSPGITGFAPPSGATGTTVTISGFGFTGALEVQFNGTDASFNVDSDNQITARVPSGATTGPITVTTPDGSATSTDSFDAIPIEHVVVIYQENHSFDNVLGAWCEKNHRCDGVTSGKTSTGREVKLGTSPDVAPTVAHSHAAQLTAIDGGKMDGFDRIRGCKPPKYPCYVQYQPPQIPNLIAYADVYALSDATFEDDTHMSFGSHLDLLAATADGFTGNNPQRTNFGKGPGWGCDSFRDAQYYFQSKTILVPACVPDQAGNGPYRSSPVSYVPTILTRLESAGISFGLYLGPGNTAGGG